MTGMIGKKLKDINFLQKKDIKDPVRDDEYMKNENISLITRGDLICTPEILLICFSFAKLNNH